jgi:hypothetical protein
MRVRPAMPPLVPSSATGGVARPTDGRGAVTDRTAAARGAWQGPGSHACALLPLGR